MLVVGGDFSNDFIFLFSFSAQEMANIHAPAPSKVFKYTYFLSSII